MDPVKFTLHSHEQSSSGDSATSMSGMLEEYARQDFDVVGFVGHDARPDLPREDHGVEVLTGTEHEIRKNPTRLHMVDFPDQGLKILAHPGATFPTDTENMALDVAERLGADAIEMFNRGEKQMPEPVMDSYPRVASDDAHNTHQIGASYMTARTGGSVEEVVEAVKDGRVSLHNPGLTAPDHFAGRMHQGISMAKFYAGGRE